MVYNDLRQTEFDFQSFGTDSALYTIMKSVNTSSTGIARLGLRDTERTTTQGVKMDHFDSEISCEEVYRDEDWVTGKEMLLHLEGTLPECEDENDGQPDEYTEWQGLYEGDDWDHGQYDYC